MNQAPGQPDPLQPHTHEPNPKPPSADPAFIWVDLSGREIVIKVDDLAKLPHTALSNCYIVSTGHGTSGPFTFSGVSLLDLVRSQLPPATCWTQLEVVSADGFGNRISAAELLHPHPADRPIILSTMLDGQKMTREQGLVRLIVPSDISGPAILPGC
jgi:hypothetical protein